MYRAKERGRNCFEIHRAEMNSAAEARLVLEGDLHQALPSGQLRVVYQPQVDMTSGRVTGVEGVAGVEDSQDETPIVAAMIATAHAPALDVVAEGIKTEAQRAFLAWHGCDMAQGYLFGRPVDEAEIATPPARARARRLRG